MAEMVAAVIAILLGVFVQIEVIGVAQLLGGGEHFGDGKVQDGLALRMGAPRPGGGLVLQLARGFEDCGARGVRDLHGGIVVQYTGDRCDGKTGVFG